MSDVLARVAEEFGYDVKLTDFVPCGQMQATAIGLARCQSQDLVAVLAKLGEDLKTKCSPSKVSHISEMMFAVTALILCGDADGFTALTDEEAADFLNRNREPIARLVMTAFSATLPGLLRTMGISEPFNPTQTGAKS